MKLSDKILLVAVVVFFMVVTIAMVMTARSAREGESGTPRSGLQQSQEAYRIAGVDSRTGDILGHD
jgi:hypothetical protein